MNTATVRRLTARVAKWETACNADFRAAFKADKLGDPAAKRAHGKLVARLEAARIALDAAHGIVYAL